ncbi:hypothetical protein ACFVXE_21195 [Streptomyces sp. NPDC058231]
MKGQPRQPVVVDTLESSSSRWPGLYLVMMVVGETFGPVVDD